MRTCSTCQEIAFAFAIGVGGENELVGILDGPGDVIGEALLGLGVHLPEHAEIGVGIDRTALRRQVAHVAERSLKNLVATAEILVDRFRLGGRFYEDQHPC